MLGDPATFSTMSTANSASRRYVGTILFLLVIVVVLLPNIVWVATANGKYYDFSTPYALMSGLLPSTLAVLLLLAILGRQPWIGVLILLPFLPLVPVETAYIAHYGEPTWYAIIATVFESNSREIVDFLGSSLWPMLTACALCLFLGVFAAIYLRATHFAWEGRSRKWAITACVSAALILVVFARLQSTNTPGESLQASNSSTTHTGNNPSWPAWTKSFESSFPVGIPIRFIHYRSEWEEMQKEISRLHSFRFNASDTRNISSRQIYVLVIGEAARADRWQLYGYPRKTNPELEKTANLILLPDLVTPWSASRMSVPIITSRKRGTDSRGFFDERSITSAFAEAGFETYWISNQMAAGGYDSPISVVAYDADHVSFHNVADYTNPGTYDEILIAPLRVALNSGAKKLFIVLHTIGSHQNYAYRYPQEYDLFKPSLKDVSAADVNNLALAERIQNSYDNSILYTDHVISAVIRALQETGAIATMWYVSDHGEDLINAKCKLTSHGSGTVYNFRIPSVLWYSDAYAAEFEPALNAFRANSSSKVTTENIFESMIDMAAIDFPGHDQSWSLFSPSWQPHQRMVASLYGQVQLDFDTATESQNCHMLIPP